MPNYHGWENDGNVIPVGDEPGKYDYFGNYPAFQSCAVRLEST